MGMAALIAAIAVLLLGAVGVTAWCAGDQGCPFVSPTNPPVTAEPPTHEPSPEITPEPTDVVLTYDPAITFDRVVVGGIPGEFEYTVFGHDDVPLSFAIGENPDEAFRTGRTCDWKGSPPALSCTVEVTFEPTAVKAYTGVLEMRVEGEPEPREISLSGDGIAAVVLDELGELKTFPETNVGDTSEQNLIFRATAPVAFTFPIQPVATDSPASFEVRASCTWTPISDGDYSCTLPVTFAPDVVGSHLGRLLIVPPGTDSEAEDVLLTGRGR